MLETHDQYWGIWIYGLGCKANFFYVNLSYYKERQYFVIPFIADIRIFIIAYFVLHCPRIPFYISCFWEQPLEIIPWNRCSPKTEIFTSKNFKLPHFIFLEYRNICFQRIILLVLLHKDEASRRQNDSDNALLLVH